MVYNNPHITGQYNPLYNPNNQGFFHRSLIQLKEGVGLFCPKGLTKRSPTDGCPGSRKLGSMVRISGL